MCMITLVPAGVEIPVEGITNGADANKDGHGWAVASKEHGLQVGKSMSVTTALAEFTAAREAHGPGSVGLFHSRWGTHGEYGVFNIHPFFVPGTDNKTVMAHNGVLPKDWIPGKEDKRSDTRLFAEDTAPEFLTMRGVPSRRGGQKIGEMIGKSNKFVFLSVLNGEPVTRIVNVDSGEWSGGCWYSNSWYKSSRFGGGTWSKGYHGSDYTAHDWWGSGFGWTAADEAEWQKEQEEIALERAERDSEFASVLGDIDKALTEQANPLDLDVSVVTDVLEDYACDFCQVKGAVHATTMICLNCKRCLDCMEEANHCTCFDWESYLAKRQEEEALWVAGLRDQMAE